MPADVPRMLTASASSFEIDAPIADYERDGYARLGRVVSDEGLALLRARADAIMLGEVKHEGLFFQHDSASGRYEELTLGEGWRGPSLDYRKIEKLEKDPIFLEWIDNDLFARIARATIEGEAVLYRAVLFNKGPRGGTDLPWHQDGGQFWGLDRQPYLQIWTALDDCPVDGGALQFVPRTHLRGLATPNGGVVPHHKLAEVDVARDTVFEPARAGEAMLIHNHTWHRSGRSVTGRARRALTICVMSAQTKCLRKKRAPRVFFPLFREN
jgi:ectoine hydroxylase-related dioxygenase (phytanoyl-CoA dioxygenase family)